MEETSVAMAMTLRSDDVSRSLLTPAGLPSPHTKRAAARPAVSSRAARPISAAPSGLHSATPGS
jgi:hypothetical protein